MTSSNQAHPASDPFQIGVETLVAAWPMLGHKLDDRRSLRDRQRPELVERYITSSACDLADEEQQLDFVCAPLDVLVERVDGELKFHIIELNGTGFGGITNLPGRVLRPILNSIEQIGATITEPEAVVLLGISGKEDPKRPRMNHLLHEKLLFAEALQRGLASTHGTAHLITADHTLAGFGLRSGPTVVLGYMKDLIDQLSHLGGSQLGFHGRPVAGILNDRFCVNVLDHFGLHADLDVMRPINTCFVAGADKAVAYDLVNAFVRDTPGARWVPGTEFTTVYDRAQLIDAVQGWVRRGRKAVIKPHGTGIGHGIRFFLDANATVAEVTGQIDSSILETETFYRVRGGAFPYTVCDFIDTCRIEKPGHPLLGHKFEVRIVVYRDGAQLRAFPSVAKIASQAFDPAKPDHAALINNVTASSEKTRKAGASFSLPLADPSALEELGIPADALEAVGPVCTGAVRHVLDALRLHPERYGLAAPPRSSPAGA